MLDLFAGLRGWSDPWRERGHETFTVDWDERFEVDAHLDINDTDAVIAALPWRPDVILASPPCEGFSVLRMGRNWATNAWRGTRDPKTATAAAGLQLVRSTVVLVERLRPAYFVIENPRAMLRKLEPLLHLERRTVTYCAFGHPSQKPTDLWGGFPPSLVLPPMCRQGDPCQHPGTARLEDGHPVRLAEPEGPTVDRVRRAGRRRCDRPGYPRTRAPRTVAHGL